MRPDRVAAREQGEEGDERKNPTQGNEEARGNVGFADGHGEFFSRKDALRQKYSGSPVPDPVGF